MVRTMRFKVLLPYVYISRMRSFRDHLLQRMTSDAPRFSPDAYLFVEIEKYSI
jgi:hypothetical protein